MDELLEILNEVKPGVDFENDTDLIGHGVLDSITMVTLVMELNDAFDIEITPVDIVPVYRLRKKEILGINRTAFCNTYRKWLPGRFSVSVIGRKKCLIHL